MLPLWYKRSCVAWMLKLSSTLVNGQTTRWTQVTNNSKTSHRSAILKVPKVQIPRKVWDGLSHPQAPCARKTREPLKLWRGLEPALACVQTSCRRLQFPLLHAEKGKGPFSAWNKGNRERLHAGKTNPWNKWHTWGPSLEGPDNFSGPKSCFMFNFENDTMKV